MEMMQFFSHQPAEPASDTLWWLLLWLVVWLSICIAVIWLLTRQFAGKISSEQPLEAIVKPKRKTTVRKKAKKV